MTNTKSATTNNVWDFSSFSDSELVSRFIMFLNGADYTNPEDIAVYESATAEVEKRSDEVKQEVAYLNDVL